ARPVRNRASAAIGSGARGSRRDAAGRYCGVALLPPAKRGHAANHVLYPGAWRGRHVCRVVLRRRLVDRSTQGRMTSSPAEMYRAPDVPKLPAQSGPNAMLAETLRWDGWDETTAVMRDHG